MGFIHWITLSLILCYSVDRHLHVNNERRLNLSLYPELLGALADFLV